MRGMPSNAGVGVSTDMSIKQNLRRIEAAYHTTGGPRQKSRYDQPKR